jgi:hypothetical protein
MDDHRPGAMVTAAPRRLTSGTSTSRGQVHGRSGHLLGLRAALITDRVPPESCPAANMLSIILDMMLSMVMS